MNQQLSSLRSQLLAVQHQLPQLLEECLGRGPLLPGSLCTLRRKCGKPNCHCNRGELHESTVLSYRGQGRPRNISPPPEQLESLRSMTLDYRRCRQARASSCAATAVAQTRRCSGGRPRPRGRSRVPQIVCVPVIEKAASLQQELTHGSRRIREQQAVGDR